MPRLDSEKVSVQGGSRSVLLGGTLSLTFLAEREASSGPGSVYARCRTSLPGPVGSCLGPARHLQKPRKWLDEGQNRGFGQSPRFHKHKPLQVDILCSYRTRGLFRPTNIRRISIVIVSEGESGHPSLSIANLRLHGAADLTRPRGGVGPWRAARCGQTSVWGCSAAAD